MGAGGWGGEKGRLEGGAVRFLRESMVLLPSSYVVIADYLPQHPIEVSSQGGWVVGEQSPLRSSGPLSSHPQIPVGKNMSGLLPRGPGLVGAGSLFQSSQSSPCLNPAHLPVMSSSSPPSPGNLATSYSQPLFPAHSPCCSSGPPRSLFSTLFLLSPTYFTHRG